MTTTTTYVCGERPVGSLQRARACQNHGTSKGRPSHTPPVVEKCIGTCGRKKGPCTIWARGAKRGRRAARTAAPQRASEQRSEPFSRAAGQGTGHQGTEHRVPATGHLAPGTGHEAPGTEHRAPANGHGALGTGHRAPGHRAPCTRAPSTGHRSPGTEHRAPGHRAPVPPTEIPGAP